MAGPLCRQIAGNLRQQIESGALARGTASRTHSASSRHEMPIRLIVTVFPPTGTSSSPARDSTAAARSAGGARVMTGAEPSRPAQGNLFTCTPEEKGAKWTN